MRAWSIVTTQAPTPVHAPVQPENAEVPPAVAVSATIVPWSKVAAQVAPQVMPTGFEVIVPAPVPPTEVVSVYCRSRKSAATVLAASIVTTHGPVPVQAPLHPANVDVASGCRTTRRSSSAWRWSRAARWISH